MAEMTDSLGRFIQGQNTSNMTLGQIKELLSSGLKVGVGEAKAFGKNPSESTSSGSVSKLTSLFEQYTKNFSSDINEQKDYIKQMIGVLTEIKNSKEENKNNPKEKEDKKSKGNEKAFKSMDDLAKKGLHKGSIYTHDVHCEHILKDIGKDLKNIAKKMKVKTNPIPTSFKLPDDYPLTTPTTIPTPTPTPTPTGGGGGGGGGANPFDSVFDDFDDGYINISKDLRGQQKNLKSAQKSLQKAQEAHHGKMIRQAIDTANTVDNFISKSLLGLTGGVFETMFQGFIKNDVKIIQDTRAIAYEIEGATKNSKSLNKSFEDFGKTVKATGVNRDEFSKNYIDSMKIGIKNAKIAQKITVAQLNAEKQLGMEAGVLKDTFQTMATDLHMNTAEVADMGRGMRDVARFTGLTGDKLKGVIDSSAEFSKNMQKAGNLTSQSYKNIIELGANFKKFGADGSQILTMLSSTNKLLEGNSETFTLLAQSASRVGLTSELLSGSLLKNKKNLQGLYQGMKSIAGQFGIAGNNAEEMRASLENMDDFTKARMNISLKAAYGMEAGELLNTLEAIGSSSETLSDKLDNLNKKKQKNLTLEERAGVVEEERKLKLSKSMEVLASIDKAASSSKDMGEALGKFSKQRSVFEGDLKALGVAWTSETDVARGAITNALDGVNKQLKDAGKAELKISSDEIEKAIKDPTAIRELTAKITKAEQEASTASKAQLDPASSAAQSLIEINDTIRNLSQNGLSSIFNSWIGKLLIPLAAIAAGVAFAGSKALSFYEWSKGWASSKKSVTDAQTEVGKNEQLIQIHTDLRAQGLSLKEIEEMARQARNPGSIYTHDIHLEKILLAIHDTIKNCCMGDKGKTPAPTSGKADPMAALTNPTPIAVPSTGKIDKQANDALKQKLLEQKSIREGTTAPKIIPPKPAGISDAEKIAAAQKRGISESGLEKMKAGLEAKSKSEKEGGSGDFRLQRKIEEHQKKKMKAEKIQIKHDGKMMKVEKEEVKVGMPSADSSFLEDAISQIKNIKTEDLIKAGGILMALAAALVILGIGIVFLGSKLLKLTGLDLATVAETAAVVVAVGAAAGGIAYASLELLGKIEELKSSGFMEKFKGGNAKELLMVAGAVAILGPILIILGAAVIKAAQLITSKLDLDLSKILEVSAIVVALGVAAGGIAVASVELIEQLEEIDWKSIDIKNVLLGAAALLVIGPAMVLLGAAIIKMSDLILGAFNLDLKTVIRVGATVAAIMIAAGLIALAAIAALPELFELGLFAELLLSNPLTLWTIGYGAAALLVLAPAIVLLGAAIIKMSDWILGAFNLDASTALKIGMTVAGVIAAAAIIAVAILGAVAGLAGLGVLATTYPSWLWMMPLGAGALLVLTPAILMLAVAIIRMSEWLLGSFNLDASTAWEIGMTVAGVIAAAAVIAVAILGAVYGLTQLGVLASTYIAWGWMFLLGAGALLALTPVILTLASAVIKMSEGILGAFGLDSGKALEVAENVAGIIAAAALIAVGIIAAIAGLTYLGILATMVYTYAPLMLLGAAALLLLTRPIIALASNIVSLADSVLGSSEIDPSKAKETADALGSILNSAGEISAGIIFASIYLANIGMMVILAPILAPLMILAALALLLLTPAILLLSGAILKMANSLSFEKGQAERIVENLDATLDATTSIAFSIIKMAIKLAIISTMAMYATLLIPFLYLGSWALWALTLPIRSYVSAVTNFYDSLIEIISPKKAVEMGKGVGDIMGAVGIVTEEIMKAKDKLSNLSQYAGFFDFLIGNSLAKTMYAGGKVLRALMLPTAYYAISVVNFSRFLASIIEPKKATQMGKDVAELLAGIAAVTDEIMKVKDKLANFPEYGSFWNWLTNNKLPDQMWKGVATLLEIMNPTKMYVMAIVLFSRNIASIIDPRKATEMGRGVAEILAGVASVNEEIMKVKDKLINVPKHSGFWTWLRGIPLQESLREGVLALHDMMGPVTTYIQTIVAFSKRVGSVIDPKQAKSMGQGVADIIDGCMVVTDSIYKVKDKLKNVPKHSAFWTFFGGGTLQDSMNEGGYALKKMMSPVKNYIESIVVFSKRIGSVIDPRQAKEMGQGVADVIDACMVVTDSIYKVKDKLKNVPKHSAFWTFFGGGTLQDSMNQGVSALNSMMVPVKNYASAIVSFSRSVGEVIDPKQAKEMGQGIADILSSVGQVSDEIIKSKDKILSVGGLTSAVKDFVKLYAASIAFRIIGNGILTFTNTMVGVVKQIEGKVDVETGKRLISVMKNVGELVSLTAQTVKDLNEKILPLTQSGWFSGSIVSQLNSAMPQFQSFFSTVPKFITDAIVKPMNTAFKDVQDLQDAGTKIKAMGILLSQVHPIIQEMQSKIVPYTQSGFFKAAPIDQIKSGMDSMRSFFTEVASFITNGIVIPVTKKMSSDDDLIDANSQLSRMSVVLASAGKVMQEMLTVIAYMDPASFFSKAPVEKIMKNKDEFKKSFIAIAQFVKDGIVAPALSVGNSKDMQTAAERLCQTASIMRSTSVVLKSVDETFGLMDSKSIFSSSPMSKIMKNKDEFRKTFLAISQFIRDGIVNPVLTTFPDPRIMITAGTIMESMAKTISSVPPIIKNLAEAIGLMTESKSFFAKTPVQTIIKNKDEFAKYFRTVAAFVRDAIVVEINTAFADVPISKIVAATDILTNLSRIIGIIPNIIKGVSDGLIPLVVSKDSINKAPLKAISESKKDFSDYFRETAAFLRDGVVKPILEEFSNADTLAKAIGIIGMMASLLPIIPRVINQISEGLIPLVKNEGMKKAPMKMIDSSKDIFKDYFISVAEFLRDGVVKPILEVLPNADTLAKAIGIIGMMASLLPIIPRVIDSLSSVLGLLDPKECMKDSPMEMLAKNAIIFAIYFYKIATFLKQGIVDPIISGMVDSKDLEKANQAINNMSAVIREIPVFIERLSDGLSTLMFSGYFNFAIFSAAKRVGDWFGGIAYSLTNGIIIPLRLLPDDTELKEIITKLKSVTQIFGNIRQTLDSFAINLQPLTEGGFFTKSPIASLYSSSKIFSDYWSAITSFIQIGIIEPVNKMSNVEELKSTYKKLSLISGIVTNIPIFVSNLSNAMGNFADNSSLDFGLIRQTEIVGSWFGGIALALVDNIINPIREMPESKEFDEIIHKLGLMTELMLAVSDGGKDFYEATQQLANSEFGQIGLASLGIGPGQISVIGGKKATEKSQMEIFHTLEDFANQGMKKGSIYTHDDRAANILQSIEEKIVLGGKFSNSKAATAQQKDSSKGGGSSGMTTAVMDTMSSGIIAKSFLSKGGVAEQIADGLKQVDLGASVVDGVKKGISVIKSPKGELTAKVSSTMEKVGETLKSSGAKAMQKVEEIGPSITSYGVKAMNKIKTVGSNISKQGYKAFDAIKSSGSSIVRYSSLAMENIKSVAPKVAEYGNMAFNKVREVGPSVAKFGSKAFNEIKNVAPQIVEHSNTAMKSFGLIGDKLFQYGRKALDALKVIGPKVVELGTKAFVKVQEIGPKVVELGTKTFAKVQEIAPKVVELGTKTFAKVQEMAPKVVELGTKAFAKVQEMAPKVAEYGAKAMAKIKDMAPKVAEYGAKAFAKVQEMAPKVAEYGAKAMAKVKDMAPKVAEYGAKAFAKVQEMAPKVAEYGAKAFAKVQEMAPKVAALGTKAMAGLSNMAPKLTEIGKTAFQGIKVAGGKIAEVSGKAFSSITAKTGEIAAKAFGKSGTITKGLGPISKLAGATKVLGPATKVLGKSLPFLSPLIGGIMGATEAAETGRGTVESTILGAITGSAKTGSMFSSWVGMKEGSTGDKALGVAGSAATGAMTGAAIGSVVPVIGTAVGAAVGGIIGGATELYKWFTEDGTSIPGAIWEGTKAVGETIWGGVKSVGSAISGVASGAASLVTGGISAVGSAISGVASGAAGLVTGSISAIWSGIKGVGSAIGSVASGAASLVTGGISAVGSAIGSVASGAASLVTGGISLVGSAIGSVASGAASLVTGGISAVGSAIGSVASGAASLVSGGVSAIWGGIKSVGSAIGSVASGAASLVTGGISAVGSAIGGVASGAANLVSGAMSTVGSAASTAFDIATAPAKMMSSMASTVGGWLFGSGTNEKIMGDAQASLASSDTGSKVGGFGASMEAMEPNNAVATAITPEPSIREKVQKEVATSEPSSAVSSPELTEIASEAVTQTELNEQMVELLTQIKDALGDTDNSTKSNAAGMGGDTESRKVRNKPFMNTKWAYGSFLQTSGKGVTNIGSGTK